MWDLPGPGLEPVSPALAGGFLTTAPPEKSWCHMYLKNFSSHIKKKETGDINFNSILGIPWQSSG